MFLDDLQAALDLGPADPTAAGRSRSRCGNLQQVGRAHWIEG
jgi:hypothetical protein